MTGARSRQAKRVAGILALAALLAFAGCNGILGGDQQNTTASSNSTTTATDGTTEPTVTDADESTGQPTEAAGRALAPGLSSTGVINSSALLRAHTAYLKNRSTITRANSSVVAPNGTVVFSLNQTIHKSQSGNRIGFSANYTGSIPSGTNVTRLDGWTVDDETYIRQTYRNGTTTFAQPAGGSVMSEGTLDARTLSTYFSDAERSNTSVETQQVNGSPRYAVSGTLSESNISADYWLSIDEQGVTRDLVAVRPNPIGGNSVRVHITLESADSTELEAPAWLSEARQQTETPTSSMPTARSTSTTNPGTSESSMSAATESGNATTTAT